MTRLVAVAGLPQEVAEWLEGSLPEVRVTSVDTAESGFDVAADAALVVVGGEAGVEWLRRARASRDLGSVPVLCCLERTVGSERIAALARDLQATELHLLPMDQQEFKRQVAKLLRLEARPARETNLEAGVAALWTKFRSSILERLAQLEEAGMALLENTLDPEARTEAARTAHKLVGSAGTFGFREASDISREIERILLSREITRADILRYSDLTVQLREELDRDPPAQIAPAPVRPAENASLFTALLIIPDGELSDAIEREANQRGARIVAVRSPGEAPRKMAGEVPDLAIVDLGSDNGAREPLRALEMLGASERPIPAMALAPADAVALRVEAARLGARVFLTSPLDARTVLDEAERLVERLRPTPFRITVVDDDPVMLQSVEAVLSSRGYLVTTLNDALELPRHLETEAPDLIVLDVDMPRLSGIEACRLIRSDPRWEAMPVLMFTSNRAPEIVASVFDAGADDFVLKPLIGEELVGRIANRLERLSLYREMADTDFLTGLPNRRKAISLFDQLSRLSTRHGQPLCVSLLDLDHFKAVNDQFGHSAGDRVLGDLANRLQRAFRGEDVVSRWGGEEFLLITYGMRKSDCVQRISEALDEFRRNGTPWEGDTTIEHTFSAGVAEFGRDGDELDDLLRAADRALYAAKSAGRNSVLPAGASAAAGDAGRLDVLVVEDDEPLGQLLTVSLASRGYTAHWIRDGYEALQWLDPNNGQPGARVVLLDVDLPGLDGLGLLRRLRLLGLLPTTRIVMLTARSNEREVLESLEAGAFDHIAKPFSVPILMQRVRRALDREP